MKFTLSIRAQWLRDTANQVVSATSMLKHHPLNFPGQFAHYGSLLSIDPHLATLVKAVINNEARYVAEYPYCESCKGLSVFCIILYL